MQAVKTGESKERGAKEIRAERYAAIEQPVIFDRLAGYEDTAKQYGDSEPHAYRARCAQPEATPGHVNRRAARKRQMLKNSVRTTFRLLAAPGPCEGSI